MHNVLKASVAGAIATIAHTLVMSALHPHLPKTRGRPLPPIEITSRIGKRVGKTLRGRPLRAASFIAHFGFGMATGAAYAPLGDRARRHSILAGIGYGLVVWAASYQGWIPATRLLESATRQPGERNATMILAHVAWGATLGAVYNALQGANMRK